VTDADLSKEATPHEYITNMLPILLQNGVVHFLGFGNRLGFDPLPTELQVENLPFYSVYLVCTWSFEDPFSPFAFPRFSYMIFLRSYFYST
jgi:hypothetical protein